jgi:hypothetical protein
MHFALCKEQQHSQKQEFFVICPLSETMKRSGVFKQLCLHANYHRITRNGRFLVRRTSFYPLRNGRLYAHMLDLVLEPSAFMQR